MKACALFLLLAVAGCAPKPPELSERAKQCVAEEFELSGDAQVRHQRMCILIAKMDCMRDGGGEWCLR